MIGLLGYAETFNFVGFYVLYLCVCVVCKMSFELYLNQSSMCVMFILEGCSRRMFDQQLKFSAFFFFNVTFVYAIFMMVCICHLYDGILMQSE